MMRAPKGPGTVKVSDVAKEVGVTPAVVYSFLNGRYYGNGAGARIGIGPATQERIREAARRLNFVPSDRAAYIRLCPERGGFLMLLCETVVEGIANPYFSRIFSGLSAHAAATDRSVSFASFSRDEDYFAHPEALPESLLSGLVNKVILGGDPNYSLILALRRLECAVVYASRDLDLPELPGIVPDYEEAARLAIEHLTNLGHRRIALACASYVNPDAYYFRQLTAGCEKTWSKLDLLDPPPRFIFPKPGCYEGGSYLETILTAIPGVTAIFCFDDYSAIGLLNAAIGKGIEVPGRISILGCNHENRPFMTVPLSTIHFPKTEIGRVSAQKLDEFLADSNSKEPATEILPVEFVAGDSCGPAPSSTVKPLSPQTASTT